MADFGGAVGRYRMVDSQLLADGARVFNALAEHREKRAFGAEVVAFQDHCRAAKRRALAIRTQLGKARRAVTYRKLLEVVRQARRAEWVAVNCGR